MIVLGETVAVIVEETILEVSGTTMVVTLGPPKFSLPLEALEARLLLPAESVTMLELAVVVVVAETLPCEELEELPDPGLTLPAKSAAL